MIDTKTTAFKRTGKFLLTVRSVQRLKWEKWRNGPLLDVDKEEIKSRNFWRAKNWSLYDYCLVKRLPEGRDISRNDHRRRHRLWRSDDVAIQSNIIFGRSEASLKNSALEALLPNSVALNLLLLPMDIGRRILGTIEQNFPHLDFGLIGNCGLLFCF